MPIHCIAGHGPGIGRTRWRNVAGSADRLDSSRFKIGSHNGKYDPFGRAVPVSEPHHFFRTSVPVTGCAQACRRRSNRVYEVVPMTAERIGTGLLRTSSGVTRTCSGRFRCEAHHTGAAGSGRESSAVVREFRPAPRDRLRGPLRWVSCGLANGYDGVRSRGREG